LTDPSVYAREAVNELTQALGWLAVSLVPGTHLPYRAPVISDETRAERALEDRMWKLQAYTGGMTPLGESPAPLNLNVMDLLSEILTAADEMAEQVAAAADVIPPPRARSAFADPGPYLRLIRNRLERAAARDDTICRHVEEKCDELVFQVHNHFGILGDGQVLTAICPWCRGRNARGFAGEHTMRIKAKLPEDEDGRPVRVTDIFAAQAAAIAHAADEPHDEQMCFPCIAAHTQWLVVCFGLNCSPPSEDCGEENYWRGHPAWDLRNEGAWLAQRLEIASAS
jgi:hypothetical protein